MDGAILGLIGGIAGSLIGIAGGAYGTYRSITGTRTPPERRFMVRLSVAFWAAAVLLIGLPLALATAHVIPMWAYWIPWLVFMSALARVIRWANRRQMQLRNS